MPNEHDIYNLQQITQSLSKAIFSHDSEKVSKIIEENHFKYASPALEMELFRHTILSNDINILQLLLNRKPSCLWNNEDLILDNIKYLCTYSTSMGHFEMFKILLEYIPLQNYNAYQNTISEVLLFTIKNNDLLTLDPLLQYIKQTKCYISPNTIADALLLAIKKNNLPMFSKLLKYIKQTKYYISPDTIASALLLDNPEMFDKLLQYFEQLPHSHLPKTIFEGLLVTTKKNDLAMFDKLLQFIKKREPFYISQDIISGALLFTIKKDDPIRLDQVLQHIESREYIFNSNAITEALLMTTKKDDQKTLEKLFDYIKRNNISLINFSNILLNAISSNSCKSVELLLKNNLVDLNQSTSRFLLFNITPLTEAIIQRNPIIVKQLLDANAKIRFIDLVLSAFVFKTSILISLINKIVKEKNSDPISSNLQPSAEKYPLNPQNSVIPPSSASSSRTSTLQFTNSSSISIPISSSLSQNDESSRQQHASSISP